MTAEEYKRKEAKKKLTASYAGIAYLKNRVYHAMVVNETDHLPYGLIYPEEEIAEVMKTATEQEEAEYSKAHYCDEWIRENYRFIDMADALAVTMLYVVERDIIAEVSKKPYVLGSLWGHYSEKIEEIAREMEAYNAIIRIMSDCFHIPELSVFRWDMEAIRTGIEMYNKKYAIVKEKIKAGEVSDPEIVELLKRDYKTIRPGKLKLKDIQEAERRVVEKDILSYPIVIDRLRNELVKIQECNK